MKDSVILSSSTLPEAYGALNKVIISPLEMTSAKLGAFNHAQAREPMSFGSRPNSYSSLFELEMRSSAQ